MAQKAGLAAVNTYLYAGNGSSPETMTLIANVSSIQETDTTKIVDVSSHSVPDSWRRKIPTLQDPGNVKFKIFYIPEEPTHANENANNIRGLRYLKVNRVLTDWQIQRPDGNTTTDSFQGYVVEFSISSPVDGVIEASITIERTGQPSYA